MLRYDQHPARQRDAITQRQAMLDTILDYRFLTPAKLAADESRERAMAGAVSPDASTEAGSAPTPGIATVRQWFGASLIALGQRLQGRARFDPDLGT